MCIRDKVLADECDFYQCYVRNQEADIYAMYIKRKNNLLDEDDFIKNDLVIDDFLLLEILINHIST
nr:hypothetical protein [Acinetobacter baumannii]